MAATSTRIWIAFAVSILLSFILGIIIGTFSIASHSQMESSADHMLDQLIREADPTVSSLLIAEMDAKNIAKHIRFLTARPHMSGTVAEQETADYVTSQWQEQGFDISTRSYKVLLSYPKKGHINSISIINPDGSEVWKSQNNEGNLMTADNHEDKDLYQPYNAFSPSGTPQGRLVYANYGRGEDFAYLAAQNISCNGTIVIMRYDKIFRGNKVLNAQLSGAIGVILFLDPGTENPKSANQSTFPDSWWVPEDGVERGNIILSKGDQATPGYPATWFAHRLSMENLTTLLPAIPSHPIGYRDAYRLLLELEGNPAPVAWQGGLNFTYRLGPSLVNNRFVKMDIENVMETKEIQNVFARVDGDIEPDRIVLVGNHRDAWTYGGLDPSSGTATILEISRAFGSLIKAGWKPRRTVMFCSWDAEEFGLVGSYEWVEENYRKLGAQAVAYLNIDSGMTGNYTLSVLSTPTLRDAVLSAAAKVPDPNVPDRTVLDVWVERDPSADQPGRPRIPLLGGGSDFVPFEQEVGTPNLDIRFKQVLHKGGLFTSRSYPLYHTAYDNLQLALMVDPHFQYARTIAAVLGEITRDLADSRLLPFSAPEYALEVRKFVQGAEKLFEKKGLQQQTEADLAALTSASHNFTAAAELFHSHLKSVDFSKNPLLLRRLNDKLMAFEKSFLDPTGLPHRPHFKHLMMSPSINDYYTSASTFPGLQDVMFMMDQQVAYLSDLKQHIAAITNAVQMAANTLEL